MFWRKKSDSSPATCPPADQTEAFVDWLLRRSGDFNGLRAAARSNPKRFVKLYAGEILSELNGSDDEASLTASIEGACAEYNEKYKDMIDSVGEVQLLPSHLQNRAVPLLVKLRVMMHVLQGRYGIAPSPTMVAISGELGTP